MLIAYLVLVAVGSYLLGAIPMGAMVAAAHRIDISEHGSGRTGTTNVLRTVGRRAALLVLLGDFLKGLVAVLLARLLTDWLVRGGGEGSSVSIIGWPVSSVALGMWLAAGGA